MKTIAFTLLNDVCRTMFPSAQYNIIEVPQTWYCFPDNSKLAEFEKI